MRIRLLLITTLILMSLAQGIEETSAPQVSKEEISKAIDAMVAQGLVSAADAQEAKKKLIQMDSKEMGNLVKEGAEKARSPGAEKMPLMPKLDPADFDSSLED